MPRVGGAATCWPRRCRILSRVDAGVQAQVRGRYETLTRALADRADAAGTGVRVRPVRHGAAGRGVLRRGGTLLPQRAEAGTRRIPLAVLPRRPVQEPRRDGQGRGGLQAGARAASRRSGDADLARPAAPGPGSPGGGGAAVRQSEQPRAANGRGRWRASAAWPSPSAITRRP